MIKRDQFFATICACITVLTLGVSIYGITLSIFPYVHDYSSSVVNLF